MRLDDQDITQLDVRVPVGMIRVLDELAGERQMTRAHYLAVLVKNAQAERDALHDAEVYRRHGSTKLGRHVEESGMGLFQEARSEAAAVPPG